MRLLILLIGISLGQAVPSPRYELPPPVFNCTVPSPGDPTSVHELRPSDVDLVAALGDSITAGYGAGAGNLSMLSYDYRGLAFSIGGDGDGDLNQVVTLPNILRQFNPNLVGFSTGIGNVLDPNSALNRAIPDSESGDMLTQAQDLVTIMQGDPQYDYVNSWKVLTVLIGRRELCLYCQYPEEPAEDFRDAVAAALDYLHSTAAVPKMLVNLVHQYDITPTQDFNTGAPGCTLGISMGCACATDEQYLPFLRDRQLAYAGLLENLIISGRYDTRNDFTVVIQPFMKNIQAPTDPDAGGILFDLKTINCWHESELGNQIYALLQWENMLTPVGFKRQDVDVDFDELINVICPTDDDPYIFTMQNSGKQ